MNAGFSGGGEVAAGQDLVAAGRAGRDRWPLAGRPGRAVAVTRYLGVAAEATTRARSG